MDVVLVYFKRDGERKDFPLESEKIVIGRNEECDYRIPVSQVSRQHCQIELTDDAVILRDLGSSNGTYVNNKRVAKTELRAGDRIVVGPAVFTVQIDGEPEDIQPVKIRLHERKHPPTDEEIADDFLGKDEDDDETRRTALFVEDDMDEDDIADDVDLEEVDDEEGTDEHDSLSDALEALASGTDDEVDPFADLDEDEEEK